MTLFAKTAKRLQPEFELTLLNVDDIVHVCEFVQGMPLGILLAASWTNILSIEEIANQFASDNGQPLAFLESDLRDIPARQRSMHAVF